MDSPVTFFCAALNPLSVLLMVVSLPSIPTRFPVALFTVPGFNVPFVKLPPMAAPAVSAIPLAIPAPALASNPNAPTNNIGSANNPFNNNLGAKRAMIPTIANLLSINTS